MRALLSAVLFAVLASTLVIAATQKEKSSQRVITVLKGQWQSTPWLLELAEYLEQENHEYFWALMDHLAELDDLPTGDKQGYEKMMEWTSRYLSQSQIKLLKFSLSLRLESPKIQMFRQVALDFGIDKLGCPAVVQNPLNDQTKCIDDVDDLEAFASKPAESSLSSSNVFGLDHHHPHREVGDNSVPSLILYAQAGTRSFGPAHQLMSSLASQGKIDYVLRPFVQDDQTHDEAVKLSGYGVELQIKSTEYKAQDDAKLEDSEQSGDKASGVGKRKDEVKGFNFDLLKSRYSEQQEKLDKLKEFRQHLIDQSYAMAPLKVWELQDLSLQAAARIMSHPETQLDALEEISQNFPSHARSLSSVSVSKDLKKEVKKNRDYFTNAMGIGPKDSMLYVNGLSYDLDYVDVFSLFDTLRSEAKSLDGLGRLGLTDKQAGALISLDLTPSGDKQQFGIDIRSRAVHWINDIEKDKVYKGWPGGVQELLRPSFPGMLRYIRKNLFHMVAYCDPASKESIPVIREIESFYSHRAPTKMGLVLVGRDGAGGLMSRAFASLMKSKGQKEALTFLVEVYDRHDSEEEDGDVTEETVKAIVAESGLSAEELTENEELENERMESLDFASKSGFREYPQLLMNGVPIERENLGSRDEIEEAALTFIMKETQNLQRAVYNGHLTDSKDVLDYLMERDQIMPRLNDRVLSSDNAKYVDFLGEAVFPLPKLEEYAVLSSASKAASLAQSLKYLTLKEDPKLNVLSGWVVADLETKEGRSLLKSGVEHVKSSSNMRVSVVHNTKNPGLISRIIQAAIETQTSQVAKSLISKVTKKEATVSALEKGSKSVTDYDIPGADMKALKERISELEADPSVFDVHAEFVQTLDGFSGGDGQRAVVLNGKVIGPLAANEVFDTDDFELLDKYSLTTFGEKLVQKFYSVMSVQTSKDGWELSNKAMKITSLLTSGKGQSKSSGTTNSKRTQLVYSSDQHSVIHLPPARNDLPAFDIVAVVDPVSQGAQKASTIVKVLHRVLNARVRIFLNCVDKHSEMPQKSYFRMVLRPEMTFDDDDHSSLAATFEDLPKSPIYTMHHHVPENWLTGPVKSVYDLDNIKFEDIEGSVYSEFELESLLLEGHCFEVNTGNPPRGLQLTLGTKTDPNVVDTIVMANLGYLQLKSNPGRWFLNIREGRSADIYGISSHENTEVPGETENVQVLISSFKSAIIKMKVFKKKDEELLQADGASGSEAEDEGLWGKITSTFGGGSSGGSESNKTGSDKSVEEDVINIFCLASGHMYERLLKIMMLSVMKNTDAKLKFWVLKNYLSPSIKEFLPEYSKRYGFEYEYVQYKWPRWLNQQKEKQRIIWGYKILFLDVLFPLDVKKVIFVDTDQIVRADLRELRDMNMKGAPYGYTPFCDSNKDMEGFRFWKQGYWKNHLAGRKYHISALYVIDLVKFRQIAAGDRLRGQYQALSQDPNSLANLDQDLPNNMIHQVPIFSLPQEWLYCETWCGKDELQYAKSIDLCNNPLTKEPKLTAARRIVSEWSDYDDEMTTLGAQIKSEAADKTQPPPPSSKQSDSRIEL